MDRRGFLGAILAAGAAPAIVRIGSLMPVRAISIPTMAEVVSVNAGRPLLNIDMITHEALLILEKNLAFSAKINRQYDELFSDSGIVTLRLR